MAVISVINQKGGVGKTVSAVNVASLINERNQDDSRNSVLLIDLDPQRNASIYLCKGALSNDLFYLALTGSKGGELNKDELITATRWCDVICASDHFSGADAEIGRIIGFHLFLKDLIEDLVASHGYRHVIIDCPPSLGTLAICALSASDWALIPIRADSFSVKGLQDVKKTIDVVSGRLNKALKVAGVFLTHHQKQTRLNQAIKTEIEGVFPGLLLESAVSSTVKISESITSSTPLVDLGSAEKPCGEYRSLVEECKQRLSL